MNKRPSLHKISEDSLFGLIEIRNNLKVLIRKKFGDENKSEPEVLDLITLFLELNKEIDTDVNARLKAKAQRDLFAKK